VRSEDLRRWKFFRNCGTSLPKYTASYVVAEQWLHLFVSLAIQLLPLFSDRKTIEGYKAKSCVPLARLSTDSRHVGYWLTSLSPLSGVHFSRAAALLKGTLVHLLTFLTQLQLRPTGTWKEKQGSHKGDPKWMGKRTEYKKMKNWNENFSLL
jgi:hypothetical protein